MKRYLTLTPEQDAAFQALSGEYRDQFLPILQRRYEFVRDLGFAYDMEADAGAVGSVLIGIRKTDEGIAVKESERVTKSRSILTAEQLPKLTPLEEAGRLALNEFAARCYGLIPKMRSQSFCFLSIREFAWTETPRGAS